MTKSESKFCQCGHCALASCLCADLVARYSFEHIAPSRGCFYRRGAAGATRRCSTMEWIPHGNHTGPTRQHPRPVRAPGEACHCQRRPRSIMKRLKACVLEGLRRPCRCTTLRPERRAAAHALPRPTRRCSTMEWIPQMLHTAGALENRCARLSAAPMAAVRIRVTARRDPPRCAAD